ncbi:hypothetical protein DSO57_1038985, partial [Entomophthora muscae]
MTRLFVGSLSFDVCVNTLQYEFGKIGKVSDIYISWDRERDCSRGFGFLTFENPSEAYDAIRVMDGAELNGRRIQ